jgi:hypothetical protein
MEKQLAVTSDTPRIVVEVYGDLGLKGWERSEIMAECTSGDDLLLEERQGEVYLRCQDNCTARVPYGASLKVKRAEGHATISSLEGALEFERVGGHLSLRNVGDTWGKRVDGHLSAKNVSGELRLGRVSGHASVRDVQGDFTADNIDGNLQLKELDGNATARVHGNARLNLDPSPGQRIACEADGSLVCRLPQDASARVVVDRADSLRVKLPGSETQNISTPFELALGEGAAEIHLKASGTVVISQLPPEFGFAAGPGFGAGFEIEDLSASIEQQIEQQLEAQLEMIDQQMEDLSAMLAMAGLPPEQAEDIQRRARQANERGAAHAQEKIRRAQERIQRKVEAASRRAAMKATAAERASRDRRRRPEPVEAAPSGIAPAAEPVSEQERLAVLKMLEQHQITPEQAEQLLAVLEGRSG